ncbi:MAG TPA: hypothetical protein VNJ04_00695 [Gemmatimonadaceae bacterium]|nr:hypothetical protein [Gemmatimonadaceae bacterium]
MTPHKLTLALTCINLGLAIAVWARPVWDKPVVAESLQIPKVIRAQAVELVDERGQVRAQLHLGEDGGGNLRLRSGDGTVRVKLAGTVDGSGLLLFDKEAEPAVWLTANKSGTSVTLAEKGKEKRVIKP